jgi:phosphatidylglycerophosphate synthase
LLDGIARRLIDPALDAAGRLLARAGISADGLTLAGLVAGLCCAAAVAAGHGWLALALLGLNRLLDGLDGAVGRASGITDRGGYLDIVCDFIVYGLVPLGFAIADPAANALAAAVLLAAFYANGASFLAYSAIAAKRGMTSATRGPKSLYFTTGLMEGTETILFFAAFMLVPSWFAPLAFVFAGLCALTTLARIALAWRVFGVDDRS